MKKLLNSRAVTAILTRLYHGWMVFCFRTSKVTWVNRETMQRLDAEGNPLIVAFWHGRMGFMPFLSYRPESTYVMVSRHGDGDLITCAMKCFKLKAVRGSSNRAAVDGKGFKDRGGTEVLREGLKVLKRGDCMAITPDGPKGPRFIAQGGAIMLAQLAGAPILPLAFSTSRAKVVQSWDRFVLPLPFAHVVMAVGEPLSVLRDADEAATEEARAELEHRLNALMQAVDTECGLCI